MELIKNDRGCYTIKESGEWLIEVVEMVYNMRIVLTPKDNPETWDFGWCYFGKDPATVTRAVLAARAFDPATESGPVGFDKALIDRR